MRLLWAALCSKGYFKKVRARSHLLFTSKYLAVKQQLPPRMHILIGNQAYGRRLLEAV